jgi:cytochrome P450
LPRTHEFCRSCKREVDRLCEDGTELTVETITNLAHVDAVVNEVVWLYKPLPSGIQAITAPAGAEINGVHGSGNCQVQILHAVIMADGRDFSQGEQFTPERWMGERSELIRDRRAYIPFGYGVRSCVGKQLALNEMRLTIARVVREFDVALGESYGGGRFWAE